MRMQPVVRSLSRGSLVLFALALSLAVAWVAEAQHRPGGAERGAIPADQTPRPDQRRARRRTHA